MSGTQSLAIRVDTSGIDAATKACERLRDAADRAAAALDSLQGKCHGGVHVTMIGEAITIEIMPPASVVEGSSEINVRKK